MFLGSAFAKMAKVVAAYKVARGGAHGGDVQVGQSHEEVLVLAAHSAEPGFGKRISFRSS